jgi:glycosyltransferase involved in cell wall biosynthesis
LKIAVISDTTYRASTPNYEHCLSFYGSEPYHCVIAKGLSERGHSVEWFAPQGSQDDFGIFHPLVCFNGSYSENEILDEISLEGLKTEYLKDFDFILDFSAVAKNIEFVRNYYGFKNYGIFRNGYNGYIVPRLRLVDRHYIVPSNQNKRIFEKHGFPDVFVAYYGIPDFYCKGDNSAEYLNSLWVGSGYYKPIDDLGYYQYFLYPHRPTPEKGSLNIIELAAAFPQETFVFMVSNNPVQQHKSALQDLKKLVVSKSLKNVKFVELPLTNKHHYFKRELMRHAKAVLSPFNPSVYLEGFGLANAEAVACLPKDSIVSANPKCVMIQNLELGEKIYSTTGKATILKRFERDYNGSLVVIKGRGTIPVKFTPEHPILVFRNGNEEFVPANEITLDDRLVMRRLKTRITNIPFTIDINKREFKHYGKQTRDYIMTEDIAYILGWYTAEGSIHHGRIQFDMGLNDSYYIDRIEAIMFNYFERKPYRETKNKAPKNIIRLAFHHKGLAEKIKEWCGTGARTKRVPDILFECEDSIIFAYLAGYIFGDGHYDHPSGRFRAGTVSKELAIQIQLLCAKLGVYTNISSSRKKAHMIKGRMLPETIYNLIYFPKSFSDNIIESDFVNRFRSIYKREIYNRYKNRRPRNHTSPIVTDDAIYIKIDKLGLEPYIGRVYNLQTTDGTFAVPFITHNCGTPLLITDSESSRELWIDEKDGLILPYDDRLYAFKMAIKHFDSYSFEPVNKFSVADCINNYENFIKDTIEKNNNG